MTAVRQDGRALADVPNSLRADKELVMAAIESNACACRHIPKSLMEDNDIRALVYANGYALYYMWPCVLADKNKVIDQVRKLPQSLSWCQHYMQDKDVIRTAVSKSGMAIYDDHRDRETVLLAVKQDGRSIKAAPVGLRSDPEVVEAALTQTAAAFEYITTNMKTEAMALFAARRHGDTLKYLPASLRSFKVIHEAMRTATKAVTDVQLQDVPSCRIFENKIAQHYVACCQVQGTDLQTVEAEASTVCTKRLCVLILSLFAWNTKTQLNCPDVPTSMLKIHTN
jgi:hypothetical protein